MSDTELYSEREQTLVKHVALKSYLCRFAHIVGTFCDAITYVDCFSGPWNVRSKELTDSSFAIALDELRKARDTLTGQGHNLKIRCFFLEKDVKAFAKLREFADQATDAEIEVRNCEFEQAINDILKFVRAGGTRAFPFIFIDPKGWTGFAMNAIAPLLKLNPSEVLINFMTSHIRRFIESPDEATQESFASLFDSADYQAKMQGLADQDREDALVNAYVEDVKRVGGFAYACTAIVLHPEIDRTHFHLVYATRNLKGIEVFKGAEKTAMDTQSQARADAQQRKREKNSRQRELFPSEVMHDSTRYDELRKRYTGIAKEEVLQRLKGGKPVQYDDVWLIALTKPLVWESDLKTWIKDWVSQRTLKLLDVESRQRVPHLGKNNKLIWIDSAVVKPV